MIGKKLRELRELKNLTQKDVSKGLQISRSTYTHYENDKRQPDYETLVNLSKFYNIPIYYFFIEEEDSSELNYNNLVAKYKKSFELFFSIFDELNRKDSISKEDYNNIKKLFEITNENNVDLSNFLTEIQNEYSKKVLNLKSRITD